MDKLNAIRTNNRIDNFLNTKEFTTWIFTEEEELEFIKSDCVWRSKKQFQLDTIMEDKKTHEYYRFSELYEKEHDDLFKYDLRYIEKVSKINNEYFSKYLVYIYNTIDNYTDKVDDFRYDLMNDWYEDCLEQIDSELIDVDLDYRNYEKYVVIKILDRYFKMYLTISDSECTLDGIKRVYPQEKTVIIYE